MNRRGFLQSAIVTSTVLALPRASQAQKTSTQLSTKALDLYSKLLALDALKLPALGYGFDSLEPAIDTLTMQIHHGKHHAAYVNNLTNALKNESGNWSLARLAAQYSLLPTAIQTPVRNNAGGHFNHCLFWSLIQPGGAKAPSTQLNKLLGKSFGSLEDLKTQFLAAATTRFGSGWAWVVLDRDGTMRLISSPNQDTPMTDGSLPLLAVDVWEHAYYLHYQNRRADYLNAVWGLINWDRVEDLYRIALEVYAVR
jgi:superoxide dismutase, Fe-Mn family